MRIAANENVSPSVIQQLRARGHDVYSAKESAPGGSDEAILSLAQAQDRIVLTHDKDFGELAFRWGLPSACGIVLIRLAGSGRDSDIQRTLEVIESRQDWAGHFSVAEHGRVRMRPLPLTGPHKPK
ncbi:MAG TPA: DUF5615 family PIN-like protein [Lacipirellulaceae bacterium]|nr:DUF5615 family PIN-like protein [Lacipirellulaceae bacterium]